MSNSGIRGHYHAFISYSHSADHRLAPTLQQALERIGTPWYRARSLRVYRDETDLYANPGLWGDLTRALDAADFLVLLASPDAARSAWVNQEVEYWLSKRPAHTVLIAITAGELAWDAAAKDFDWTRTDCIPAALGKRFDDVPTAADLRDVQARKLGDPDFTQQAAKLVAAIRKLPMRELYDREMTRYRRRLRLIGATAVTLAALLVVVGWQLLRIEAQNRDTLAEALGGRARVEQVTAPARATLLAATAVALSDNVRRQGQWTAAAHGLADWTANLPGARLQDFTEAGVVVADAAGATRAIPVPAGDLAAGSTPAGLAVIDPGKCIAPDYVTPAPQGGDVPVCNASELGFRAGSPSALWVTFGGDVSAAPPAASCGAALLLWRNPILGGLSASRVDAAFLTANAHPTALTEDDDSGAPVDPPAGWAQLGSIERPATSAACALLYLTSTRQLRRWDPEAGESLVSDASYGEVEDYRVSTDGRWVAIQHAGGRFDVRRADPLRARPSRGLRWASAVRLADGSYRGFEIAAQKSGSTHCLRAVGTTACAIELRPTPGVLGGEGNVFIQAGGTGGEQMLVSSFPGFRLCRPAGESVECGEEFGVQRGVSRAVAISADARRAAVAQGEAVKLFDLPVDKWGSPRAEVAFSATELAFDGPVLWAGGLGGLGIVEDEGAFAKQADLRVVHLAVLAGGGRVVVEDGGGGLHLVRRGGETVVGSLPQPATALAASAKQPLVAVGQRDGLILWDIESRSEIARIDTGATVHSVRFRSDDAELWFVTDQGVTVLPTDPDVLLRRTCELRLSDDAWREVVEQPPPVDPCRPRGTVARLLAQVGVR